MELKDYSSYLINECMSLAQSKGTTPEDEYTDYMIQLLEENQAYIGLTKSYFEMTGARQKKIQIDGWGYDEADQSFILFCSKFDGFCMIPTLTNSELDKYARYMEAFIENALSGYIVDNAEFSSSGVAVARQLRTYYGSEKIVKFKLLLIANIPLSKAVKKVEREKINGKDVIYDVWNLERTYQSDAFSQQKEDITIDVTQYAKDGLKCIKAFEEQNDEYTAYLCIIPGQMLYDIYKKYGSDLLEGNVRNFLSFSGKVNKGIKNTIESQPSYFFTYNNGIATTAKSIELNEHENITRITNLQIINGGQTTATLFFSKYNDKSNLVDLSKVYVAMKLTVVNQDEKYEGVIEKISRYSNTQNKVDESDFFSNSIFHRQFKDWADRTYTPILNGKVRATRWFYERAKGSYKSSQMMLQTKAQRDRFKDDWPTEQKITKTDLAKYYMIYKKHPAIVCKGGQYAMRDFAKLYEKELKGKVTEKFYKDCISLAIIYTHTDKLLPKQSWYIPGQKAYTIVYAMAKLFDMIDTKYNGKMVLNLNAVWNRQDMYPELETLMLDLTHRMQDIMLDPNRHFKNVIEWSRKESSWDEIRQVNIPLPQEFIETLLDGEYEDSLQRSAVKETRVLKKVEDYIEVIQLGGTFWKGVMAQCQERHIGMSSKEASIMQIAMSIPDDPNRLTGRIPSETQGKILISFLKSAYERGMNPDIIPQKSDWPLKEELYK